MVISMSKITKRFMVVFIIFSILFFIGVGFLALDNIFGADGINTADETSSSNQVFVGVTILERNETNK